MSTTVTQQQTFFDRALTNLSTVWRDLAEGAARSIGVKVGDAGADDAGALQKLMQACLDARGGEVSARARAAELGRIYLRLDADGRRRFLEVLAHRFAIDGKSVAEAIELYETAADEAGRLIAERRLRQALVPPRQRLLTQFNALPEGVKFLSDLRADLLTWRDEDPQLRGLDDDLRELLASWFDTGFLDLRRITWESSAALLEKLIAYEAVHEIRSWEDMRNRLDSDRRCYALFHPRMPNEPLAFVEVALVKGMAGNVQALLDEEAPRADPSEADTAIFYSISNTQRGLQGISFGDHLIKAVVQQMNHELPQIQAFATLSPIPGFRKWLAAQEEDGLRMALSEEEEERLREFSTAESLPEVLAELLSSPDWWRQEPVAKALEAPLVRLCLRYFLDKDAKGQPHDPVARFHLRNGARLERINWLGDLSSRGLKQSAGLMVNYRYLPDEIEKNHEAFVGKGTIVLGTDPRSQARRLKEAAGAGKPLRRLRIA